MKKQGLTFPEHYEVGRNLRQIKGQAKSIHTLLSKKFGATKKFTKQTERIGICVDKITDDMNKMVRKMSDIPPDIDNYYYKI